ncbi:molybdenum cofactor guanylyltransferase [Alteribacillus persepolensis]|uniref:Probable molybdenum cofactor guanylyltransferase n=1 Tax=Alteribacillus persepolensis TaxID=568899 RepID=A0A1G8FY05_9BACI|nr:molybdenum cofactor guanylyltransferase [Alteribacillus persepolensis]SDH87042.1 molybdenum cofactor guanylyltransferase [Alteribacillus persepolensis]
MKISGIVLAGGKSSRYGKPKMFERYKGKQLYEYSVDALLCNGIKPVYILTNENLVNHFHKKDIRLYVDPRKYEGPLAALYYGIKEIRSTWFFVLAADMPFVTAEFVHEWKVMAEKMDTEYEAVIPVANRKQPLAALYHKSSVPKMKEVLQEGHRSMYHLLKKLKVEEKPFEKKVFTNINRPSDWKSPVGESKRKQPFVLD